MRETQTMTISFSRWMILAMLSQIGFGFPCLILLVVMKLFNLEMAVFFFSAFSLLPGTIVTIFTWLMAKGSNVALAMKPLLVIPGSLYGLLFGGMVVGSFTGQVGSTIGAISFFIIGGYLCIIMSDKLRPRILPA